MDLIDFLHENYYMLVPVLWVIGYFLKTTPSIPDWAIAWILLLVSLVGATFFFGFTGETLYNGVIAAGVAVYGHQLYKQTAQAKVKKNKVKTH